MSNLLKGRGKGGGSGDVRTPIEEANTLRSRSVVHLIDLLGEGPWEGFCTADGITCVDCVLQSLPVIVDGAVTFPVVQFAGDSSGYPFNLAYPIYAYVDGDGKDCKIRVDVWPRNQSEKEAFIARFSGEFDETTAQIHPEGKVCRIVVVSGGTGYTTATVTIPPSSWQSIFFDDVPLANSVDLSANFRDVRVAYRMGTADQTYMPGFDSVQEVLDVPEKEEISRKNDPNGYVFQIDGENFDRLVVNLTFPAGLYRSNKKNGDIEQIDNGIKIRITQRYRSSLTASFGGERPFGEEHYVVSGKSMSSFQKSFEGRLEKDPGVEGHFWQIIIRRETDDDETVNPVDTTFRYVTNFGFSNATAYTDVKLTYPFCVLVGLVINADQFSRIPKRAYRSKMLKWPCPTNYFPPYSRRQDGTLRTAAEYNRAVVNGQAIEVVDSAGRPINQLWDGSFYTTWTNNPAYIFLGVCTESRIGLGKYLVGGVADKWELYTIGRHCDELVFNGYKDGVYQYAEPRYTLNAYVQEKTEAFSFLSDLASTFRGMVYWKAGKVFVTQDRKNKPKRIRLNQTDFVGGIIDYPGTGKKARNTVAIVQFNDPERNYDLQPVVFEDYEGMMKYGVRTRRFTRFGCSSKGEARRAAKAAILDEQRNTDTLNGTLGIKGSLLQPGDLFELDDPTRANVRFGGRIVAISSDDLGNAVVTTDAPMETTVLDDDNVANYRLVCVTPVGEVKPEDVQSESDIDEIFKRQMTPPLLVRSFSSDPNGRLTIKIEGALPAGVVPGTTFGLQSSVVRPQTFRVVSIEESGKHEFPLLAVEWSEALFDAVDKDDPFYETPINPDLDAWRVVNPPTNLVLYVNQKREQGVLVYDLEVSWTRPQKGFSTGYEVYLGKGLANPQFATATTGTNVRIRLAEAAAYGVRVYNIGLNGKRSIPLTGSTVVGVIDGDNVEVISGLEMTGMGNATEFFTPSVSFSWRLNWSEEESDIEQGVPPLLPPGVQNYKVQIIDPITGDEVLTRDVTDRTFVLDLDTNKTLNNGPLRDLIFGIQVRTVDGALSAQAAIRVVNNKPEAPTFTVADDTNGNAIVTITSARSADFKAYVVWVSPTPGFTPLPGLLRYQGDASLITLPLDIGVPHYIKVGELDQLSGGPEDAEPSAEQSVTTSALARLSVFDFSQSR